MELTHRFTVPASRERTWAAFNDIESVAGCFPGAVVTGVDGDSFTGSAKVKLGPIALTYAGTGQFLDKDEAGGRFVLEAKGKDKRGNGTAGATVTATMTEAGPDRTDVEVLTELAITGKPAQFGRGVIQDVSDKLLGQFMDCLEQRLSAPAPEPQADQPADQHAAPGQQAGPEPEAEGSYATAAPEAGASAPLLARVGGAAGATVTPESETPIAAASQAAVAGSAGVGSGGVGSAGAGSTAGGAGTTARAGVALGHGRSTGAEPDDALDLGATVLPILVKTYWKQLLGALLVALVVRRLLRGRGE